MTITSTKNDHQVIATATGTNTGTSDSILLKPGKFSLELAFTGTGTVVLERALSESGTFYTYHNQYTGTAESHTANVSKILEVAENGEWFRINVSAHAGSGNIVATISQRR